MAGNVEEFLRRAIQQKLGKRFDEVEVLPADDLQPIPTAKVREFADDGASGQASAQHGAAGISERVSHLSEQVQGAEKPLEEHLHEPFDHQIGTLQHDDGISGNNRSSSESSPQGLRQFFQSKSALRNAIIFREIIDRPADRW